MLGHKSLSRSSSFQVENLGQNPLVLVGSLCCTIVVFGVLIFTFFVATYQPSDPLFHPSTKTTTFPTSTSNATFRSDISILKTDEDLLASKQSTFDAFINLTDVVVPAVINSECESDIGSPIDCTDPEIFQLMMMAAIEHFKDIHFYRFGKSVQGSNDSTCDMAWRFRPKERKTASFFKDYRRFLISSSGNCNYAVVGIGEYHSGLNARKRKTNQKTGSASKQQLPDAGLLMFGETVNDSLTVVESEAAFSKGRYLIYMGGGDRCKSMNHYLWSFSCALGEAQYLKRTLVVDLSICLSSIYTASKQDEEGKDFRFYFDFEHLKESASVLELNEFWKGWAKWQKKDDLSLHLVEDFRVTPMKLVNVKDALIMRKFGSVEPDNYWYRVCEGETASVIQRPWHMIWKSRWLMDIVSAIAARLNWDFDSVHVVRGEKAKNTGLWPNLVADTAPEALRSTLSGKIKDGRNLYVVTNEPNTSFFDPLKDCYSTHFLNDYRDLWDEKSEWYMETKKLNDGVSAEFDGYMRAEVNTEMFLRGKKQIETFNDLTSDCKNGINTCHSTS
ncbi:hypothetical protein AAC387_Pa11g1735 [Persea americana]